MTMFERAAYFPCGDAALFGIVACPASHEPSDLAVVILPEGIPGGIRGQNAVLARLARTLADAGFTSLRFDYHGVGESTGPLPVIRRDQPLLDDLDAALAWLGGQGYRRFVVVGSCFGAQTALLAAADRPEILGLGLLCCLVAAQDDEATPPSPGVLRAVGEAVHRRIPLLFCYGRDDPVYAEFEAARPFGLDDAVAAENVEVAVLDGTLHSFVDVDLQPVAIDTVVRWLARTAGRLPGLAPVTGSWTSR